MTYRPVPVTATEPTQEAPMLGNGAPATHHHPMLKVSPFRTRTTWTPEQARAMAVKSRASKAAKAEAARAAAAAPTANPPASQSASRDAYLEARLKRIRAQLDKLDRMIAEETDPQRIDRLASAQSKLAEQERMTAGRPTPGSQRPAPETQRSRSSSFLAPADLPPATPQEGQAQEQE